jgi:hypothetical protein
LDPDCSNTVYDTAVSTIPFRRCDSSNLGVSRLCNIGDSRYQFLFLFLVTIASDQKDSVIAIARDIAIAIDSACTSIRKLLLGCQYWGTTASAFVSIR